MVALPNSHNGIKDERYREGHDFLVVPFRCRD